MPDGFERSSSDNWRRASALCLLVLIIGFVEISTGWRLAYESDIEIAKNGRNTLDVQFETRTSTREGFADNGKYRIVYISNSHAGTGGEIVKHLQRLLDGVAGDRFEVLDLSAPGIFAPNYLQRLLFARQFEPDLFVIGAAYIAFSDRMKLARQSFSVRSFYRDGIRADLTPAFWLRHYDIELYLSTAVDNVLNLFRYRNRLRDRWEQPLVGIAERFGMSRPINFFEVDEHQGWRFPEGYDRNLFQWHLYSHGRSRHLADMRDLVDAADEADIPIIAFNVPVDWEKSQHPHSETDYQRFQHEIAEVFADASAYIDYQGRFPVVPFTYDALHPSWHGARLFAFDIAIRLLETGALNTTRANLLTQHIKTGVSDTQSFYSTLVHARVEKNAETGARRFDLMEPDNAIDLINRVASWQTGAKPQAHFLYALSLHLRLLRDRGYQAQRMVDIHDQTLARAAEFEIKQVHERAELFAKAVKHILAQTLNAYPRITTEGATLIEERTVASSANLSHIESLYQRRDSARIVIRKTMSGQIFAEAISDPASGLAYRRTDIFGDGSFLMLDFLHDKGILPEWLVNIQPKTDLGL